jgi:hypothetical protein
MKKMLPMGVVLVLVLSGLGAVAIRSNNTINTCSLNDELDQYMTDCEGAIPVGAVSIFTPDEIVNLSVAQSFIPQKEMLTRVEFYMGKNCTTTFPVNVVIREELNGENLARATAGPDGFPVYNPSYPCENLTWIEFDFDDIHVTPGETYYMVVSTYNDSENYYWVGGNGSDMYPNGIVYLSVDDGETWEEIPDGDGCFKTYGKDNLPPERVTIIGPNSGKTGIEYEYRFVSTDPDGDDLLYYIFWDDGTVENWIGPFESGETITLNHTWNTPDTYHIAAEVKDVYGAESPYPPTTLDVVIVDNEPPGKPTVSGTTNGKAGVLYEYTFNSVDLHGDELYYYINWGDGSNSGWIGPYPSGDDVKVSHAWSKGTYNIKAKTADDPCGDGHGSPGNSGDGLESEWSDPYPIAMPKSNNLLLNPQKGYLYTSFTDENGIPFWFLGNLVVFIYQDVEVTAVSAEADKVEFVVKKSGVEVASATVFSDDGIFTHNFERPGIGMHSLTSEAYQGSTKVQSETISRIFLICP